MCYDVIKKKKTKCAEYTVDLKYDTNIFDGGVL